MSKIRNSIIAEPVLTPLCDATMTLIVIFIMTLPTVMWSGFNVDSTRAENKPDAVEPKKDETQYAAVSITEKGFYFNGSLTSEKNLFGYLKNWADEVKTKKQENMLVVLPDDNIAVENVVRVLDIARLAGAEKFALLEPAKNKASN